MVKVSVIMPAYNQKNQYLQEAVNSVRSQTFQDWELIIVDDGSDEPIEITGVPKARVIKQDNKGVAGALNAGIKEAKGEWIAWLSSDDKWYNSKLDVQLTYASQNPGAKFIYTDWNYVNETGQFVSNTFEPEFKTLEEVQHRLCHRFFACGSFTLIHKSVFDDVGLFDESYKGAEDHEMWGRIASKYMMHKVNIVAGEYRTHPGALRYNESINPNKEILRARDAVRKLLDSEHKVSVIIAAHNEAKTIKRCIEAASEPSQVKEVFVVNDGSTDDTKNIIEDLNSSNKKIIIINNERQLGRAQTRNKAIRQSKYQLIATIDGDTVPNRGWLDVLLEHLDNSWLDAVAGSVEWSSPNMGYWEQPINYYQTVTSTKSIGTVCTLFKKEMLDQLNGFNEETTSGEDSDFFMRAEKAGFKFVKLKKILGIHYEFRTFFEWLARHYEYGKDRAEIFIHHRDVMEGQVSQEETEPDKPPELVKIIETICALIGTLGFREHFQKKMFEGRRGEVR